MRAPRQQPCHIFGTDDGERIGLRRARNRREKNMAAWLDQACAGFDGRSGVWDVLQEFETGDDVVRFGRTFGQSLRPDMLIVRIEQTFVAMQFGCIQSRLTEIDTQNVGAGSCERLGEDTTTAADVDDSQTTQPARALDDVVSTYRIEVVEGSQRTGFVPPFAG